MSLSAVLIFDNAEVAVSSEEPPRFNASETVESAPLSLRSTVAIE